MASPPTILASLLALASVLPAAQAAEPASSGLPPVADFFRLPQMTLPRLSPDGKHVAITLRDKDDAAKLVVIDPLEPKNTKIVAGFGDADIGAYHWVTADRLIYSSKPGQEGAVREQAFPGLWSVKFDGTDVRQLINTGFDQSTASTRLANTMLDPNWGVMDIPLDHSGEVIVGHARGNTRHELTSIKLARLNVATGGMTSIDTGIKGSAKNWHFDPQGQPWAYSTTDGPTITTFLRNANGEWLEWNKGNMFEYRLDEPMWSDGTGNYLVEGSTPAGTAAVYRLDSQTLQHGPQPIMETAGYDFNGSPILDPDTAKLVGVSYETDALGMVWLVPAMKSAQAVIDKLLPGRDNLLQCAHCTDHPIVLVTSLSDTGPPEFFHYDTQVGKLQFLGSSWPWIKRDHMGSRDYVTVKARDGLEFPMLVTMPQGKASAPRPAVMLVHGGPMVRGTHWQWEGMAQFLASRGYVVLEPEYRGSEGYGWNLFHAGWKQWGLAMQDDVSDAVQWAVKKGWVDGKRVCLAGASYGGYATLMGLIKDPDEYRCGIAWAAVSDLGYISSTYWSDQGDEWREYGSKVQVGDPVKDAEQFARTSPIKRAAELKVPLLLGHGGEDRRVPMRHALDFRDAVIAGGNKDVEWVFYPDEGHGWHRLQDNVDFWTRAEKLLARTIGPGTP